MVSGSLRATDTLYSTTAQFQILRAPTTSGGTTFGPGTANNLLKSNGTSIYWTTLAASDIPNLSTDKLNSGTLGVARGGTGAASFTANSVIISGNTTTAALTTRAIYNRTSKGNLEWTANTTDTHIITKNTLAYWDGSYSGTSSNLTYCVKGTFGNAVTYGVDDATANGALGTGTGLTTERSVYYGLVTVNNASQTRATGIYAPTSAGTANQILVSAGGTSAPTWKATANGAAYATSANGALTFGTLPVAQGGTGQTSIANIKAGKDGDGNTISSTYLKLSGGTMTGDVTAPTFIGDLTGTASSSPKLTLQAGNVSSTSTDTYATNGLNIRWFSTAGCIPGQPFQYGFLLTAAAADSSKETHQIFMVQADGSLYHRGTNNGSYTNPPAFKTILDSANYTSYLVTASGTLGGLGSTFKDNSNPVNTRITRFNNVVTFTICGFHTKSSGSTELVSTNASIGLTIPDNFKPGKTVYMPVTGSNGTHYVLMILSTGAVNLSTLNGTIPANTWVYGSTSWIAGY